MFQLLLLLLQHPNRVVTRDELVDAVWQGRFISDSAVSARIAAARKAVGDTGKDQKVIRTVHGTGVMLVPKVEIGDAAHNLQPVSYQTDDIQRIRFTRNEHGQRLAFSVTGSGSPVMAMGVLLTRDIHHEWENQPERRLIDAVRARHRLLRFDNLGSGQSDRVPVEISFGAIADEAKLVAEAAGFERFAMYSESGGALPAIHFAAKYPEMLEKLVIIGGYAEGRSLRAQRQRPELMRALIEEGWNEPLGAFATAFMTTYFPEGPLESVHELVDMMQKSCSPETMLKLRDAINEASVLHLLQRVQCPTLIIHSRNDAVHPLTQAQKLAAGIPNSELVVLDSANHVPLPGNAVWDCFLASFLDFLED
ncbi:alpha/beta fold hydrolase [Primorskyibacter sp. S87]|uniref:alpha/beta fold hydrolase n=1 Tax=Primorskyibacter sp. S87 TaxID=3415126 RepID=UPI003C7EBEF6